MPNGGSDNCGTCWFFDQNNGSTGFSTQPGSCSIRGLTVQHPLHTYCNNLPKHRPQRDPVPIGPAYESDNTSTHGLGRKVWQPSPDTEEIRSHLLDLLAATPEVPVKEYPSVYTDEVVVWQLGEFREQRAISGLRRIAAFSADLRGRGRTGIIALASRVLAALEGN